MMKNVRKISNKYYLRQIVSCWLMCYMLFCFGIPAKVAMAEVVMTSNPVGTVTVTPLNGGITQDMTATHGAIGNFSDFDIAGGHLVNCVQPNSTSQALFRVSGSATEIYGTFNANGGIWLVNPAGILVGKGGAINVNQLVASSLNMSNADFTSGLSSGVFRFSDGLNAGDVINEGIIAAERMAALIGKNVANRGLITGIEEGDCQFVIMAAGDTVTLRQNGSVAVEFSMGNGSPADFHVEQADCENLSNADHVILAAGDLYSAAIEGVETLRAEVKGSIEADDLEGIYAYDEADSDAVATVDIVSEGDITIDDDIEAVAIGDGIDDAIAAVTITAAGDVDVRADYEDCVTVKAVAVDGTNNNADVTITAGSDAKVIAENGGEAQVKAVAVDGTNNNADVTITAGDDVKVIGSGWGSGPASNAKVIAVAVEGENNAANVDLTAGNDVKVIGKDGGEASVKAVAKYASTNTADIAVDAGGDVLVLAKGSGAQGEYYSEASIEAIAEFADNSTANVTLTALGDDCEDCGDGDVKVIAKDGAQAEVEAKSMNSFDNTANVTIDAAGAAKVIAEGYGSGPDSEAEIMALAKNDGSFIDYVDVLGDITEGVLDETISGISNTANVDITAGNYVEVKGENRGQAEIEAIAKNDIGIWNGEFIGEDEIPLEVINLTINNVQNNADVTITAPGDIKFEDEQSGDVLVTATEGGKAKVGAEAKNEIYNESYYTVNLTVNGPVVNSADVKIDAGVDVEVTANLEGSRSISEIEVKAENEIYDYSYTMNLTIPGLTNNSAGIDITAGQDVLAQAENGSIASIEAKTKNEFDVYYSGAQFTGSLANSSNIKIDAGGSVEAVALGYGSGPPSLAEIEAEAMYGSDNSANIEIDAVCNVEVAAENGGKAEVEAKAMYGFDNSAVVDIAADGDVLVSAIGCGYETDSEAEIMALAKNEGDLLRYYAQELPDGGFIVDGLTNTAIVDITGANVEVRGEESGEAEIEALAGNEFELYGIPVVRLQADTDDDSDIDIEPLDVVIGNITNTATVDVAAKGNGEEDSGDVKVIAECGGEADIDAKAWNELYTGYTVASTEPYYLNLIVDGPVDNTADIAIAAADDVKVIGKYGGDADIKAKAWNEIGGGMYPSSYEVQVQPYLPLCLTITGTVANNADITIAAADSVKVIGKYGGDAYIYTDTWNLFPYEYEDVSGDITNTANTIINAGGDVKVLGIWGDGGIEAYAHGGSTNTANVSVDTPGNVEVKAGGCEADIYAEAGEGTQNNASVSLGGPGHKIGGDVKVIAELGEAYIEALTYNEQYYGGQKNTSDVLICTEGALNVLAGVCEEGDRGFEGSASAYIDAAAHCSPQNSASVGIGAVEGVLVKAENEGCAEILSETGWGYNDTAETIVCTKGDIWVVGNGGGAYIGSEALDGFQSWVEPYTDAHINAYTGLCAEGDIIVAAGFDPQDIADCQIPEGAGGEAFVYSEASVSYGSEDSTTNARTVAVSTKGSVGVAEITGEVSNDTAGITAEAYDAYKNTASVGVAAGADLTPADVAAIKESGSYLGDSFLPPGDVYVMALGDRSNARILAEAYNGYENTADTVVCAPGEVIVTAIGEGSLAKIKSWARNGELNSATTQVYASDVYVDVPGLYRGNGIGAWADGSAWVHVPYGDGDYDYCLADDGALVLTDGGSILIIDTYANRKDCPECPPCPCEQEQPVPPPAPLNAMQFAGITERVPAISGCPAIVAAATQELGITPENLQVAMANSMASASDIQPCDTCARLVGAAAILKDADGSRMQALVEAINAIAPANIPFTPEIGTQIATTFEGHKGDGTAYASALEYVDAFAEYVKVLDKEMNSPVGDSVAFVMEKYGQGVTSSDNANVAAFVAMRLEAIGK